MMNRGQFWFYFRKSIFQIIIPNILALCSMIDFFDKLERFNFSYNHFYFYTAIILFTYTLLCRILEYIFSITSENILLRKDIEFDLELGLANSASIMGGNLNDITNFNNHCIVLSKRIFKLRYSSSKIFRFFSNLSWIIGLDCPILISTEIVHKMGNVEEINVDNEDMLLVNTLSSLASYYPTKYNVVPIQDDSSSNEIETLLPEILVSPMDQKISEVQMELFNRKLDQ